MDKNELAEWTEHFLRHKDMMKKEIIDIRKSDDFDLIIEKKDKLVFVSAVIQLKNIDVFLKKITPDKDEFILVLLNTKHNLDQFKKSWNEVSKHKNLIVIFSNPDAKATETKWILRPFLHNMISEKNSISKGLDALFEGVEAA